MTVSQADRLEAYEAFTSVVGRKVAGTLMNELKELDDGIVGLNHKVDLLAVQVERVNARLDELTGAMGTRFSSVDSQFSAVDSWFSSIESQLNGIHNWLRAMVIGFLGFGATVVVTVLQMR